MIGAFESGMVAIDSSDDQEVTGFICPEDAIRILVCVNACAGFSNDELEGANLHKDSIDAQNEIDELRTDLATAEQYSRQKQARIDRLERERDELLLYKNLAKEYGLLVFCDIAEITQKRDELLAEIIKAREEMSCANFNSAAERIDHAIDSVKGSAA